MQTVTGEQRSPSFEMALEALAPRHFGLQRFRNGWIGQFSPIGTIAFAPLAWPHAQAVSYERVGGQRVATNALGLLVRLQQEVWGFPAEEAVPVNVLSILEDSGGAVLVAYDLSKGFDADGWLGFAIGMGTRSGLMYSHMLGVREDVRGMLDLGWYLKVLQGYLAVESGHFAMTWTFDPMRGANARLNLEKLKATMVNLTVDKYGVMRSSLYGDVPTDRFTAHWDLLSPVMHERLHDVALHQFQPAGLDDIEHLPRATIDSIDDLERDGASPVVYEIPGDIDELMRRNPEAAIGWRKEMRSVLGRLMTRRQASLDDTAATEGPISVSARVEQGNYEVTSFATGMDGSGDRRSFYVLERKDVR